MKAISGCVVDSQDVYLSLFRRLSGCAKCCGESGGSKGEVDKTQRKIRQVKGKGPKSHFSKIIIFSALGWQHRPTIKGPGHNFSSVR